MKANGAPEKLYLLPNGLISYRRNTDEDVEFTQTNAFIEKAVEWIKENITNNPNANSVLVRNGCVTLGMLVDNFKKNMKGE